MLTPMISHKIYTDHELTDMMHLRGVRPSAQRIAVLSAIANSGRHPSADEIFRLVVKLYPSLSRTTVYNSLHALAQAGLIRELDIESGTCHYDLALQPVHSHFMCRQCGQIFDMALPEGVADSHSQGFIVDQVDVIYRGTCPQCIK